LAPALSSTFSSAVAVDADSDNGEDLASIRLIVSSICVTEVALDGSWALEVWFCADGNIDMAGWLGGLTCGAATQKYLNLGVDSGDI